MAAAIHSSTAGQYLGIIGSVLRGHSGGKTNIFKKSPHLNGFQISQMESQLNGADS